MYCYSNFATGFCRNLCGIIIHTLISLSLSLFQDFDAEGRFLKVLWILPLLSASLRSWFTCLFHIVMSFQRIYTILFDRLNISDWQMADFTPSSVNSLNFAWIWTALSEFVSSSIPSWQILTAHAQPFRGARDLAFCLKVPLDSLPVWASSGGSGETARMRRLAWTFAARICDKYQIRLTRSIYTTQNKFSNCFCM